VTTEITTPATLCPSYTLTVYEVNPNAIIGDQTQLAQTEFTLRADQVGRQVDRTVSATLEGDQRDGDGEAELKVKLDDACANPIITPDSVVREGIQVKETIQPIPGTDSDEPPTDPDGDDEFEDINGDEKFTFIDVVTYLFSIDSADNYSSAQTEGLDFDESGKIGFLDVVELLFDL
jgi:PKD repeat protein